MTFGPQGPILREAQALSGPALDRRIVALAGLLVGGALFVGCPKGGMNDPGVVATVKQMELVHGQIEVWAQEHRRAPSMEQGLAAVFNGEVPKDAWGNDIIYLVPGPEGWAFDLVSFGSDAERGGKGTATDLVWSEMNTQ